MKYDNRGKILPRLHFSMKNVLEFYNTFIFCFVILVLKKVWGKMRIEWIGNFFFFFRLFLKTEKEKRKKKNFFSMINTWFQLKLYQFVFFSCTWVVFWSFFFILDNYKKKKKIPFLNKKTIDDNFFFFFFFPLHKKKKAKCQDKIGNK